MINERLPREEETVGPDRRRFMRGLGIASLAALATGVVPGFTGEALADDDDDDDDDRRRRRWHRRYREGYRRDRYRRRLSASALG